MNSHSFLKTENRKTGNVRYFIDGKRVSEDQFNLVNFLCRAKGFRFNSAFTSTEKTLLRSGHCFDA